MYIQQNSSYPKLEIYFIRTLEVVQFTFGSLHNNRVSQILHRWRSCNDVLPYRYRSTTKMVQARHDV